MKTKPHNTFSRIKQIAYCCTYNVKTIPCRGCLKYLDVLVCVSGIDIDPHSLFNFISMRIFYRANDLFTFDVTLYVPATFFHIVL